MRLSPSPCAASRKSADSTRDAWSREAAFHSCHGRRASATRQSKLLVTIAGALSEIATQNYHVREKLAQIAQIVKTA